MDLDQPTDDAVRQLALRGWLPIMTYRLRMPLIEICCRCLSPGRWGYFASRLTVSDWASYDLPSLLHCAVPLKKLRSTGHIGIHECRRQDCHFPHSFVGKVGS